jgi:glucose-6-phosphate 1-dehydrogenase
MTPRADAFVFFGATGDLARKMIFPALYRLVKTRRLDVPVIGVAFSGWDAAQLAKRATESVAAHGGLDDREALAKLLSLVRYVDGDYNNAKTFDALRVALGDAKRPVHYLAIPPKLFATSSPGWASTGARATAGSSWRSRSATTSPARAS